MTHSSNPDFTPDNGPAHGRRPRFRLRDVSGIKAKLIVQRGKLVGVVLSGSQEALRALAPRRRGNAFASDWSGLTTFG
jgi:predicted LPLAT superfamily acyltransferase